jgi:N-methylhydantoinase A
MPAPLAITKTGLVATKGFGDAMLMMRGAVAAGLPEAEANHAAALTKPEPFVPKRLIAEVDERIDFAKAWFGKRPMPARNVP